MKRIGALLLALALLLPSLALGEDAWLMVELPQDAQMVENIEFEDGDYIQTYQLSGGARVQLLRYASFDMTIADLIASEWEGCTDMRALDMAHVGGAAEGLRFTHQAAGQDALDVTLALVKADGAALVFEAVFPRKLGDAQIDASVQAMLNTMNVMNASGAAAAEAAEVG